MWRRLLLVVLFLAVGLVGVAAADDPVAPGDWRRPAGEYLFVMLAPHSSGMVSSSGETYRQSGLYRPGSAEPLWTVDFYAFEGMVHLLDDGKHLARLGPWPPTHDYGELAVAFYREGRLLRRYSVKDLVERPHQLPHSVSQYHWLEYGATRFDPAAQHLTVVTRHGVTHRFDMTTGKKLVSAPQPWASPYWMALGALLPLAALAAGLALRKRSMR